MSNIRIVRKAHRNKVLIVQVSANEEKNIVHTM